MTTQKNSAKWRKSSGNLKSKADAVAAAGRRGADGVKDTEIIHVNKAELPIVDRALKRYGGKGSVNPDTGKREYLLGSTGGGSYGSGSNRASSGWGGMTSNKGKGTAGGGNKSDQAVPTKATGPTPANDTFGSPESAAAANASLGSGESMGAPSAPTQAASEPKPSTFTPMDKPKPMGATEYREGADALGVAGTIASGIAGNAARALAQGVGLGDKDPLKDHIGKQTGWHLDSEFGGKAVGGPGTKAEKKAKGDSFGATSASTSSASAATSASDSGGATGVIGGITYTVNPDGTLRFQDTSVAGLRAQRRYGAKLKAAV